MTSDASRSCLAPCRRVEKRPFRRWAHAPGAGWGLPIACEPTVHHWGFADRRPRTHRRRRPGRLQGRFTPVADHAAPRSRRHDPLAPLVAAVSPIARRASGIDREPPVSVPTRSEAGSCSQRVSAAPSSKRDPANPKNPRRNAANNCPQENPLGDRVSGRVRSESNFPACEPAANDRHRGR